MQPPTEVLADAVNGQVKAIAGDLLVSLSRMYELLSKDDAYVKLWRILRPLGVRKPEGLRLLQADFNARCEAILGEAKAVTAADAHREFSEALQAWLDGKTTEEQRRELIQAGAVIQHRLEELNQLGGKEQSAKSTEAIN